METLLGGLGSAFGLSSSAGLNAYIPLLIVGLASRFPHADPFIKLGEPYSLLSSWWVIGVVAVLLLIEVFVDKIPAVDTINDVVQTLVRPTAGAILFAANADVITDISPVIAIVLGILVSGSVHATKGAVRPVVTASTAGTGNWVVSLIEDIVAVAMSLLALIVPLLIAVISVLFIGLLLWLYIRRRQKRQNLVFK